MRLSDLSALFNNQTFVDDDDGSELSLYPYETVLETEKVIAHFLILLKIKTLDKFAKNFPKFFDSLPFFTGNKDT